MATELEKAEELFKQFKTKEAYPIFEELAGKGDARAMYFMGIYSRLFLGAGKYNPETSMKWFKKGAEAGDALCAVSLAYLHEDAKERNEAMKKCLPAAEKLAEAGDVFALDDTADCYFYGLGTEKNEKKGLENIEKAAKAGYWLAKFDLACQYDDNGHYDEDYKKAVEGYKEVSEMGYSEADYRLGFHYAQGSGVERNPMKAIELWKKAWNRGNAAAANALGFVYSFDKNGNKNDKEAFFWFKKAADAGLALAAGNVGNCYYYGRGVEKDMNAAKKWYAIGAAAGITSSMLQLGVIMKTEHHDEEAFKLFLTAANRGYPAAMNWTAACYEHGIGVEKDQGKELFWLRRAAGFGDREAIETLQRKYPQNTLVKTNDDLDEEVPEEILKAASLAKEAKKLN